MNDVNDVVLVFLLLILNIFQWSRSGVIIVHFEQILQIFLMFVLLSLTK